MSVGNYVHGVNPQIIKWAREKAGYSVEEVAEKTNKGINLIKEWESGVSVPTYNQLEDLAYRLYKRPLAIFFFPDPPIEENLDESFRAMPSNELDNISPNVRFLIRDAKFIQITLRELNNNQNPSDRNILDDIEIDDSLNIPEVASDVREYLNIDIDIQQGWVSSDEALKYWRKVVESVGIFIFKNAFKQNDISGFSLFDHEFPIIYLNNTNSFTRQIFTIFHELYHLLLCRNGITKNNQDYFSKLNALDLKIETQCNEFASEILVPSFDFNRRIYSKEINEGLIDQLAKLYSVSREVILRRFLNLDLVTTANYREMAYKWNQEYLRNKKESGGGDYYNTQYSYFGENYLSLLFRKHYERQISLEQISQLLNIKIQNVPKLEHLLLERKSG